MNMMLVVVSGRIVGAAGDGYKGPGSLVVAPSGFSWDNADRYKYEDEEWIEEAPFSVTARQGLVFLHRIGLLGSIESIFDEMEEPGRTEAKIEWERTSVIERDNNLLQKVKTMMQWSEEDLDQMFIEANKI